MTYAQQGGACRPATLPHSTICASRKDQNAVIIPTLAQRPVASFFAKYYGTGDGARTDAPCHTITVKDRMAHVQAALQVPPFTEAHTPRAKAVAEFLRAHGVWDGGDVVTLEIDGATYVITDIGLRMLTLRELFNAQGFPPDYVIDGHWQEDGGKPDKVLSVEPRLHQPRTGHPAQV